MDLKGKIVMKDEKNSTKYMLQDEMTGTSSLALTE
jgi:hypothetical protein